MHVPYLTTHTTQVSGHWLQAMLLPTSTAQLFWTAPGAPATVTASRGGYELKSVRAATPAAGAEKFEAILRPFQCIFDVIMHGKRDYPAALFASYLASTHYTRRRAATLRPPHSTGTSLPTCRWAWLCAPGTSHRPARLSRLQGATAARCSPHSSPPPQ